MQLWDGLTPQERQRHISEQLTPGRVLLLHCDFTMPPKNKYLVLGSAHPEPLFLVINTRLTNFIMKNEQLRQCQVLLRQSEHDFLQHDSYIDCTAAHVIALSEIYRQVEVDVSRIKCELSANARDQVIATVKFSMTLPEVDKAALLDAF